MSDAAANRAWRLKNIYRIRTKEGEDIAFSPNKVQTELYNSLHNRNVILKARQLGMTTLIQILLLDLCMFRPNTAAGVIADTKTHASDFFDRNIRHAYDHLPEEIKQTNPAKQDSARKLAFQNGSTITLDTSLRSGTCQYLHISEYATLWEKTPRQAQEVQHGSLATVPPTGYIWIESTAKGKFGHFYELCQRARKLKESGSTLSKLDWRFHFFPWMDDPIYAQTEGRYTESYQSYFDSLKMKGIHLTPEQMNWYAYTATDYGTSMGREYPTTPDEAFEVPLEGSIFGHKVAAILAKSISKTVPVNTRLPIHATSDIGVKDYTAIWFFQIINGWIHLLGYMQDSNQDASHYGKFARQYADSLGSYLGCIMLPHDGNKRDFTSAKSAAQILREMNIEVKVSEKPATKQVGINETNHLLDRVHFNQDECMLGIDHLKSYHWKENVGDGRSEPDHDEHSHAADSLQTLALGLGRLPEARGLYWGDIEDSEKTQLSRRERAFAGRRNYV